MSDRRGYVIWSIEHGAWWKARHAGYTEDLTEAGRYTYDTATQIVADANRDCPPGLCHECLIPLATFGDLLERFIRLPDRYQRAVLKAIDQLGVSQLTDD